MIAKILFWIMIIWIAEAVIDGKDGAKLSTWLWLVAVLVAGVWLSETIGL